MENELWIMNTYGISFWIVCLLAFILILTVIGLIIWGFRSSRQINAIEKIREDIDREIVEKNMKHRFSKDEQLAYIEEKLKGVEETLILFKTDIEDISRERHSCKISLKESDEEEKIDRGETAEKTEDTFGESLSLSATDSNAGKINKAKGRSGKIYTESEIDELIMS